MKELNQLSEKIIGAAIEVHKEIGPGVLEHAYQRALAHELQIRGHQVQCEVSKPIVYKGLTIPDAYRIDIVVDDLIVLELKAVEAIKDVHKAQLLTYLRMSGKELGLLINFHSPLLKDGIRRLINSRK